MARVYVPIFFIVVAVIVWSIVDIVLIDSRRVRGIPKGGWIVLVLLLPVVGSVLWFLLGRERLTAAARYAAMGPIAPDDDPEFLNQLNRDKEQQERIRDLEERLAELDDDDPKP
jgi:cbb3-type cytochrome oxidase subunit 3